VLAHHADAPFIRGHAVGLPPDLADWERPRRLAGLSVEVACFGHGEPLTRDASAMLGSAAQSLPADTDCMSC
jgi:hypothetical protein